MTSAHHLALRTENVYIRMQSTFSFFSSFFFPHLPLESLHAGRRNCSRAGRSGGTRRIVLLKRLARVHQATARMRTKTGNCFLYVFSSLSFFWHII